jgi:hypothetical protein
MATGRMGLFFRRDQLDAVQLRGKKIFPGELPERKSTESILLTGCSLAKNLADSLEAPTMFTNRTHRDLPNLGAGSTLLLVEELPVSSGHACSAPARSRLVDAPPTSRFSILGLANTNEAVAVATADSGQRLTTRSCNWFAD